MNILFKITFPVEAFNKVAREGGAGQKFGAILEATKPEVFYFTGNDSGRGAIAVYKVADGAAVPALAEPWFLTFNAKIDYSIAISPDEMMNANLDAVLKRWA
jgi:hypothetical protein